MAENGAVPRSVLATTASMLEESTPSVLLSSRRSSALDAPAFGVAVTWTVTALPTGSATDDGETEKVPSLPTRLTS